MHVFNMVVKKYNVTIFQLTFNSINKFVFDRSKSTTLDDHTTENFKHLFFRYQALSYQNLEVLCFAKMVWFKNYSATLIKFYLSDEVSDKPSLKNDQNQKIDAALSVSFIVFLYNINIFYLPCHDVWVGVE